MKNLRVVLMLVAVLAASDSFANTVTVNWAANHSPSGGEFILTQGGGNSFLSFCIEDNEFVSIGGTYNYAVSDRAVAGGFDGPHPDPISVGTAWLYSHFRAGTLAGYSSASSANQTDLQNAFWWLEQEIGVAANIPGYSFTTNPYLIAAKGALSAATFSALQADANGAYGVVALNLYNADGSRAQDMLGLPDGGSTITLLGSTLFVIGMLRRRITRS